MQTGGTSILYGLVFQFDFQLTPTFPHISAFYVAYRKTLRMITIC